MTARSLTLLTPCAAVLVAAAFPAGAAAAQQPRPCCTITALDAQTGIASARDNASGNVFEFRARVPAMLARVRVGQAIHANFATKRVSIDGRTVCCAINKAPAAAVAETPAPRAGARAPVERTAGGGAVSRPTRVDALSTKVRTTRQYPMPQITYGEPIPAGARTRSTRFEGRLAPVATRVVEASVGGRRTERTITHVRGVNGIRNSRLPDGAKRLLEMHVRKLKIDEATYYLVDEQLAREWAATHEVPPEVKPKEEEKEEDDSDCGTISWNGAQDCANDAADAVSDVADAVAAEFERNRKKAQEWWDESTEELAEKWNEAANCFTDHPFEGPSFPVRFSYTKNMSVDMSQGGGKGSTGQATGTLTLGVPIQGDFDTQVNFLYIPCLPFAFRPSRITADGELTVGQEIVAEIGASGTFSKRFTLPPTGGPQIPLYVIPIVIGNVPVAVIDVSLYLEGEVDVKAKGKATGRFSVANSQRHRFRFSCHAGGCSGQPRSTSAPSMTEQAAQIEGQVSIQPGIYAALQLSFDYNVLQGRAGAQPYLLGIANGCAASAITQASGSTVATTSHALTTDVDWSVKLRAEALSGGQRIGKRWEKQVMDDKHIWFKDLAPGGSTAFVATVVPPAQASPGQPATLLVRMPTCYPYDEKVHYSISWTGDATPTAMSACSWSAANRTGRCEYAPAQPLPLRFTWQSAGAHTVTVRAVKDEHDRTFSPTPAATTVTVNVGGSGGGAP